MTSTNNKNIVIIGGGHNGLVCAAYLAKAGKKVTVLEAAGEVGGAAVTREFAPDFRVSSCAHLLNLLDKNIAKDLQLEKHGLVMAKSGLSTISLSEDGNHLVLSGDAGGRQRHEPRSGGIERIPPLHGPLRRRDRQTAQPQTATLRFRPAQ